MKRKNLLIEADELLKKLNNENIRIFDATITDDVYQEQHIPGAVYFNHERFSVTNSTYMCTILSIDELARQIGKAGISNDSEVVVYACGMLPYAIRAWWILKYAGHDNVRVLNGGLSAWKEADGNIEQVARQYEPAAFQGRARVNMFASKEEVFASLENKDVVIMNVLPPVSYDASHIPGSVNISCMDLMQGLEYLLPDDQLASRLKQTPKQKRIITYCGGGIAATVNAAAYLLAGHQNVSIYDGSMYEWLGDKMPVVGNGNWEIWQLK